MSLRGFLEETEKKGEVVHVKKRVSPRFEASSIMKAFDNGLILYFRQGQMYAEPDKELVSIKVTH